MATVLITGANRGIGLALARTWAARGDTVIGTARNPEAATGLKALPQATVLAVDVADEASVMAAARAAGDRAIDIVICNAGRRMCSNCII